MILLKNKQALSDYSIEKTIMAGVVLSGGEVKSLRNKSGSLTGSYVKIIKNEAFLLNAQISPYAFANNQEYDPKRTRKILLKKAEILKLIELQDQKKMVLVSLAFETFGRTIKLKVGIGRGMKQFEKRDKIKKRDQKRDQERDLRRW